MFPGPPLKSNRLLTGKNRKLLDIMMHDYKVELKKSKWLHGVFALKGSASLNTSC